jgi:cobalt-zinc-cadmium efflux system outer membrane protein
MGFIARIWSKWGTALALVLLSLQAGQGRGGDARLVNLLPPLAQVPKSNGGKPEKLPPPANLLTLGDLINLAAENHPDLQAARSKAEAARGRLVQAGLYPNPQISPIAEELGNRQNAAGFVGMDVVQDIITAGKRRLARAAAQHGVDAADWQAMTRWFDVLTRLRVAYYDYLASQREVAVARELVELSEKNLAATKEGVKSGVRTRPDILRAQVDLDQNGIRFKTAQMRLEAAKRLLVNAVGIGSLPTFAIAGDLETPAPDFAWQPVVEWVLERSSEIQEAQANLLQAEVLVVRAQREVIPNIKLDMRPLYDFIDQTAEAQISAQVTVPIWNKNQGNIAAARAEVSLKEAEVRQVALRLTERLALAFQRYQTARQQSEVYKKHIVPNAESSLKLIRLGYENGDAKYDFTALLQAEQVLVQAKLALVQSLGDLWRATSEIMGLLQDDPRK